MLVEKETTTNRHVAVVVAESGRQRQDLDAIGWRIALEDPTRKWQKCGRGHDDGMDTGFKAIDDTVVLDRR